MIKFDRIVAYGCSMTAGDETMDHIFVDSLSEYEVDKSKLDCDALWCPSWNDKYYTPEYCSDKTLFDEQGKWIWGEQLRRTKEAAWPRWLADKFGVPWVNRALGGSGIEYAIYCYEEDLAKGEITDNDLILFGLTTPHRWFWLDETGRPKKPLLTYIADWPSRRFHEEYLATVGNIFQCYWDYYWQIKYIDSLYHMTNGRVKSFYVSMAHHSPFRWVSDNNFWDSDLHKITSKLSKFPSIMKMDYYFKSYEFHRDWPRGEPHPDYCGFGHPKIHIQQEMAEELYKYLTNE